MPSFSSGETSFYTVVLMNGNHMDRNVKYMCTTQQCCCGLLTTVRHELQHSDLGQDIIKIFWPLISLTDKCHQHSLENYALEQWQRS